MAVMVREATCFFLPRRLGLLRYLAYRPFAWGRVAKMFLYHIATEFRI
jgi:hypothetical protein